MDPIREVQALFPAWVRLLPLGYPLLVAVLSWSLARLGVAIVLGPYRKLPRDSHWSERARLAFPARQFANLFAMTMISAALLFTFLYTGKFSPISPSLLGNLAALAGFVPALLAAQRVEREVTGLRLGLSGWLRSIACFWLVMLPGVIILMACAFVAGPRLDLSALAAVLFGAAGLTVAPRGLALRIACVLRLARPAPDELRAIVATTAEQMGQPTPRVLVISWAKMNAVAFPFAGTIAFTERAVQLLESAELATVAAHEMAHLAEPKQALAARAVLSYALRLRWWFPFR